MSEWQKIETAPRTESVVLYRTGWREAIAVGYWSGDFEFWVIHGGGCFTAPTHWMPLPPPPEES